MTILLNSFALNAVVAAVLAVLVWIVATIPCVRCRPGLRHFLWVIVLLKLVTPPLFELSILPNWFAAEPQPVAHPRAIPLDDLAGLSLTPSVSPNVHQTGQQSWGIDWIMVLAVVSGLGTVAVLSLAIGQTWRLRRALRRGESNDDRLIRIAHVRAKHGAPSPTSSLCCLGQSIATAVGAQSRAFGGDPASAGGSDE